MAKYCANCGNKVDENAYICVKCGVVINNTVDKTLNNSSVVDSGGIGWAFLGYFIPIVGLILYLAWKDEKPKTAKMVGKGALISTIIGICLYILMMIIFGIIFLGFASAF